MNKDTSKFKLEKCAHIFWSVFFGQMSLIVIDRRTACLEWCASPFCVEMPSGRLPLLTFPRNGTFGVRN